MNKRPVCAFCSRPAQFIAAQSNDQGKSIGWVLICPNHKEGWNDGGDWSAPVYSVSTMLTDKQIVLSVQRQLSGREWSSDTSSAVAEILHNNGYPIEGLEP